MYRSRRRYRHRSNTPMYYSRNPVKTLHPYTGTSNFAIETKDIPKAATYLRDNGYTVYTPGTSPGPDPDPPQPTDKRIAIESINITSSNGSEIYANFTKFNFNPTLKSVSMQPNFLLLIFTESNEGDPPFYYNLTIYYYTKSADATIPSQVYYIILPTNGKLYNIQYLDSEGNVVIEDKYFKNTLGDLVLRNDEIIHFSFTHFSFLSMLESD